MPHCGSDERVAVMAHRFSIGLSVGHLALAPKDAPDARSRFGIGELSLRYRVGLHLELEAAMGGGREQLSDGSKGDRELGEVVFAARYRFAPAQRWNWWLMGGLGGITVAAHDATDQARKDASRGQVQLGIGVERRFERFALQAELRAIGVARDASKDGADAMAGTVNAATGPAPSPMTTTPPPPTSTSTLGGQSGGQLTIGASYYF